MQSLRRLTQTRSALCITKRRFTVLSQYPPDFAFFPTFLDSSEQHTLLAACLKKLDLVENRTMRKRRQEYIASRPPLPLDTKDSGGLMNCFLPDECYHFEDGHFDGVIKRYREMHVSSWDRVDSPALSATLKRLRSLFPTDAETQTHILHLASDGEIWPHVDNVGASGSWIMGISLGDQRILRLDAATPQDGAASVYEIPLPSGSVYIQRDSTRYEYKHSIIRTDTSRPPQQRLSVMIRVSFVKLCSIYNSDVSHRIGGLEIASHPHCSWTSCTASVVT
ncbi:hypothetical protein OF83DRAFT_1108234 [Amylostereum chailletii]|nr:hypothetical protein OF83DRAFT_1108234 [Amylostereum chailletii]